MFSFPSMNRWIFDSRSRTSKEGNVNFGKAFNNIISIKTILPTSENHACRNKFKKNAHESHPRMVCIFHPSFCYTDIIWFDELSSLLLRSDQMWRETLWFRNRRRDSSKSNSMYSLISTTSLPSMKTANFGTNWHGNWALS